MLIAAVGSFSVVADADDVSTCGVVIPCMHENMHETVVSKESGWTSAGSLGHGHLATIERFCVECDYTETSTAITDIASHSLVLVSTDYIEKDDKVVEIHRYYSCNTCDYSVCEVTYD